MTNDNLWIEDQADDLDHSLPRRKQRSNHIDGAAFGDRHIGCPLWWFRLVLPVVRGKSELAVALFIYRLRAIRRSRTVVVTNERLFTELGIDRYAKYRALHRLADAGIIRIKNHGKRATEITFLQKRGRRARENL